MDYVLQRVAERLPMILDPNSRELSALDSFNVAVVRPTAFLGGTTDARGDKDGANSAFTLFNVTGDVLVRIFGVCTVDLVGAATIEVGVAGNTAALIAQTANATTIDANEIYNDATSAIGTDTLANITGPHVIVNGLNIIETTAAADITAGNSLR